MLHIPHKLIETSKMQMVFIGKVAGSLHWTLKLLGMLNKFMLLYMHSSGPL